MPRFASLLSLVAACCAFGADSWPRFRGPNGDGRGDVDIPAQWTPRNVAWQVAVPGEGHSSPVVHGSDVFLTSSDKKAGTRIVLCLDAGSGKARWKKEEKGAAYRTHRANSLATSTPALDAERVYVYWAAPASGAVVAYSHAGKEEWRAALPGYKSKHGGGASLALHDGTLLVHHQPDGDGELVALDAATGKKRWTHPRIGAKNATYSAPCIRVGQGGAAEAVVTNWQLGITGVDLKTGRTAWTKAVFDTEDQQRCIPSPVLAGDLVLGVCGFAGGTRRLAALRPGPTPELAWKVEAGIGQMATPLVVKDRVLACNEAGIVTWLDAKTGKEIWRKRIGGSYHASPVLAGDRLYLASTDGKMVVLAASDTFKLLAENKMPEGTQATPAICGGRMYVRTEGHLLCLAPEPK